MRMQFEDDMTQYDATADNGLFSSSSINNALQQLLQWTLYTNIGVASLYLVIITAIEVVVAWYSPVLGLWACSILLILTLFHATTIWGQPLYRLLIAISFAPLIRLISLSIPLTQVDQIYWYVITGFPLIVSGYATMVAMNYSWKDVAMTGGQFWVQMGIASTGIIFGFMEYAILQPEPFIEINRIGDILLPSLILIIGTGFFEEFVFRGIMQRAAIDAAGDAFGLLYVAAVFAVLHIGYRSFEDLVFVFSAGLMWGIAAYRTNSIVGVTLAHGLTNIFLFIILPYYASI